MQIQAMALRVRTRVDLSKAIPLPAPLVVFIEPSSLCDFRCAFCPTGDAELRQRRPNGMMSIDTFCNVVDDMQDAGWKVKRVNLYKDGEPLLNPNLPGMIDYLNRAQVTDSIWMKTNGWRLTPQLSAELLDAGLDMIGFSIKGVSTAQYKAISQVDISYPELVEKVTRFFKMAEGRCKVYVSLADSGLAEDERVKFYEDFEGRCDFAAIEGLHGWSASSLKDFTLGTHNSFDGLPLVDKVVCPWAFYTMAVNWNGTVSVCNEDWLHGTIVGDVRTENMQEIWRGERFRKMQLMFLEGRRGEHPVCGDCYYLKCAPDNLDAHREELLGRLK